MSNETVAYLGAFFLAAVLASLAGSAAMGAAIAIAAAAAALQAAKVRSGPELRPVRVRARRPEQH